MLFFRFLLFRESLFSILLSHKWNLHKRISISSRSTTSGSEPEVVSVVVGEKKEFRIFEKGEKHVDINQTSLRLFSWNFFPE